MQIKVPLTYSEIYPETNIVIDDLLKQINKEKLVQTVIYLSRDKELENLDIFRFIEAFFPSKNKDFVLNLKQKILNQKPEDISNLTVITKSTCYYLLEKVISIESKTESMIDLEIIVFKALLLINEDLFTDSKNTLSLITNGDRVSHAKLLYMTVLPYHDISNYNLGTEFMNESYKAIQLFNFLNLNSKLEPTLDILFKEFDCQNSNEYLRLMFATVLPELIDKDKKLHYLSYNRSIESEDKQFRFVEKIAFSKYYEIDTLDFIALRSKPLIKLNDSTFLIVSDIFLCQLIHNSLYFKLSDVYKKSELAKSLGIECVAIFDYLKDIGQLEQGQFDQYYKMLDEIPRMLFSMVRKFSRDNLI